MQCAARSWGESGQSRTGRVEGAEQRERVHQAKGTAGSFIEQGLGRGGPQKIGDTETVCPHVLGRNLLSSGML